jgi:hypothetical protein
MVHLVVHVLGIFKHEFFVVGRNNKVPWINGFNSTI